MRIRKNSAPLLAFILAIPLCGAWAAPRERGFAPLFDGKTLAGWHETGTKGWAVRDGVIAAPGRGGGWLRSDREYEDFVLRLEFRNSKGGNSGVFVRAGTQGRTSRTGVEVQILDDAGKKPNRHSSGSLYDLVAPRKIAVKPAGEWNAYEISARGSRIRVKLNGELVQDVRMDDPALNAAVAEQHRGEPGFPLLKDRRRRGYIGLQNHGDPIEFRRIRIRDFRRPKPYPDTPEPHEHKTLVDPLSLRIDGEPSPRRHGDMVNPTPPMG